MPKRTPPKPKPHAKYPLAVRRMLMRLERREKRAWDAYESMATELGQMTKKLDESRAAYNRLAAELATLKRGTIDPSLMRGDSWSPLLGLFGVPVLHLSQEQHDAIDRILAALPLPDPAPQAGAVVVSVRDDRDYWTDSFLHEAGWDYFAVCPQFRCDLESEGDEAAQIINNNTPAEVQVPPFGAGMPGMTLGPIYTRTGTDRILWSWMTWDWRRSPLTCPAVADSREGRASLLGVEAVKVCRRITPTSESPMWGGQLWGDLCVLEPAAVFPLPPATWRRA